MPTTQRPFYNQSSEVHATLKESLILEQHLPFGTANGIANGFVPGRPVLEVPGWRERFGAQPSAFASSSSTHSSLSRLRIFSGTSNPVRHHDRSCPALPCPALPCPALPCPSLPCPVPPPRILSPWRCHGLAGSNSSLLPFPCPHCPFL